MKLLNMSQALTNPQVADKIKTQTEILEINLDLKDKDNKIVFTNGCFDIIHAGHIQYLEEAKSLGDVLILGLNSDQSVRNLKGKNRPINNQHDRALILAALEAVDYVVIFDQDNPFELVEAIKPNILVKGSDYEGKEVIGSDQADELILVKFINGKSSTETIKKIQQFSN